MKRLLLALLLLNICLGFFAQTTDKEPVKMAADLYKLGGDTVEVVLHAQIHRGYHIYASVAEDDPFIKTEIIMTPAEGYRKVGIMMRPPRQPLVAGSKTTIHEGDCLWRQKYVGKGNGSFTITVNYQCCNKDICFPPKTVNFEVKVKV